MSENRKNWTEFDWERAFREEDERVNSYMKVLPRYIDLPSEDEVIMRKVMGPSYNRELDTPQNLLDDFELDSNPFDDEDDAALDWQTRPGAELYITASTLARLWAQTSAKATTVSPEQNLRILAYYSMIMARASDLIDMHADAYPQPLKCAIAKRVGSLINELLGEFGAMRDAPGDLTKIAERHFDALLRLRDTLLGLLAKFRAPADGDNDA